MNLIKMVYIWDGWVVYILLQIFFFGTYFPLEKRPNWLSILLAIHRRNQKTLVKPF